MFIVQATKYMFETNDKEKYKKSTTTLDFVMMLMFLIMVVYIFRAKASKLKKSHKSKIRNYKVLISTNRINRIGTD
jgi:hypothetical protein